MTDFANNVADERIAELEDALRPFMECAKTLTRRSAYTGEQVKPDDVVNIYVTSQALSNAAEVLAKGEKK